MSFPRARTLFWVSWLLASLLSIAWAIATPVAASPDEPAHMVKAASVVRGQFVGEPSSLGHIVQVPNYVAVTHAETCFAFKPGVTADCVDALAGDGGAIVDSTTTAGLYNPVYYLLVGWPSLIFGTEFGLYAMRAMSAVLFSLFLALTVVTVSGWRRPALPLAALAVATAPMLLFLGGSVNPNAVETSATLAAFAGMLGVVLHPSRSLLAQRSMIVLAGSVVAANTRGLSMLWVFLAIALPLVLASWAEIRELLRQRPVQWAIGGTAVGVGFALVWLLRSNSLTAAVELEDNFQTFPGVGTHPIAGFLMTLRDTFGYAQGMIGNFGWLDTPAPLGVYFIWSVLCGAILLAGFAVLRGRRAVFAAALAACFFLLPPVIQGAYITGGGIIWQGRYNLPLFAMAVLGVVAVISAGIRAEGAAARSVLLRLGLIVWLLWAIAQFASFADAMRRYAVGAGGAWKQLLTAPDWAPPGGTLPWLAVFAVLVCATAWLGWSAGRRLDAAAPPAAPGTPTDTPSSAPHVMRPPSGPDAAAELTPAGTGL
ncbi:DUF2142 domain-containing protein [Microterricola viridarii]|uniref:Predicted membrane protein n=1 Tax=Microterricola viridarii TaxID=412690 RepID=A0A1H1QYA1_9MICO|nr:DUF2142 domain-containing protein [Microterricola viridarii]SDS28468.1 Predicted membrane protein [Microterricola viridarii]